MMIKVTLERTITVIDKQAVAAIAFLADINMSYEITQDEISQYKVHCSYIGETITGNSVEEVIIDLAEIIMSHGLFDKDGYFQALHKKVVLIEDFKRWLEEGNDAP